MRNDFCDKCGVSDFYQKGNFSYCRPCHTEAQKRYKQRQALGEQVETLKGPSLPLSALLQSNSLLKPVCKYGHPMSGDNAAISSQRAGRHLRRRCRTCERNAKRLRYGLEPEAAPTTLNKLLDS